MTQISILFFNSSQANATSIYHLIGTKLFVSVMPLIKSVYTTDEKVD